VHTHRRVDVGDIRATDAAEVAAQNRARERVCIQLVDLAEISDAEFLDFVRRDLLENGAKLFAEGEIGLQQGEGMRVHRRHVDRIAHDATVQNFGEGLGHFDADAFLGFLC